MKKIITLSMIKNEADIVETFVRYTMNFASKMVFIDNGSTDGSMEILKALIGEGFPIEIYIEADKFYDQYLLENQYIRKITEENQFDFMIPLDVDEFLASDGNLLEQFDLLPSDRITMLNWKTYCIISDHKTGFFLDRIIHVRKNEDEVFTKVVLPFDLIRKNRILVTMGHHDIECETEIMKYVPDEIYIAHFPVRSMEQIRLKIYQGIIAQLMSNCHRVVAFHWKKLHEELRERRFDLVKYSMEYALPDTQDKSRLKYAERRFDSSWCMNPIKPRYDRFQKINTLDAIYEMLQAVAIKSIISIGENKIKILIYGTGGTAITLFDFISKEKYDILAYVDSDVTKEYGRFQDRLIIAPDKIKYIDYDRIIIASKFYDEIYGILLNLGVKKEKIFSRFKMVEDQIIS